MTLDRTISPQVKEPDMFRLPQPRRVVFPNATELYILDMGEQDVCRIDLMWEIGNYEEPVHLSADMANKMLKEGAGGMSAAAIAEKLDYYGAWLQTTVTSYCSYVTLYSLNKYFDEVLPLLETIVKYPDFPEQDFYTLKERRKQQLRISLEKVQTLSNNAFRKQIFGKDHPYAYAPSVSDYENLTVNHLRKLHKLYYRPERCRIVISGKISRNILKGIEEKFGRYTVTTTEEPLAIPDYPVLPADKFEYIEDKPGALQSSVRVGQPVILRSHPDFQKLRVVNTALGGYFGSRLMANIREEKGYTYGIGSFNVSLPQRSYWSITTEVNNEYTEATIEEIFKEIHKLRTETVPAEELNLVKNYLYGDLLRELDGVFAQSDSLKHKLNYGLDNSFYIGIIEKIRQCTPEAILELADKYWNPEEMYIVTAGQP